jgi:predicted RNA binding protein YcfA (HicA-like mRNA interferase family)
MLTNSREIIRPLEREGFRLVSSRGSHHKYRHPESHRVAIVVHPKRDIPLGTVKKIYKDAGWPKD